VQGIGASLSGLAAGLIVDHLGYGMAFLNSGAVAVIALVVLLLAMPETAQGRKIRVWPVPPEPGQRSDVATTGTLAAPAQRALLRKADSNVRITWS